MNCRSQAERSEREGKKGEKYVLTVGSSQCFMIGTVGLVVHVCLS